MIEEGKNKPVAEAAQIINTINQENLEKLTKLFRNCYAIISKNRPISDFTWQCELDEVKGLDIGTTYRNRTYAKTFLQSIADVELSCEHHK